MPSIPFYATDDDLRVVLGRLNDDREVAFVAADGPGRWRAVERLTGSIPAHSLLWHRPGGPLPLLGNADADTVTIADPFRGWEERVPSAVRGVPFLGSVPMVISWDVSPETRARDAAVPMSAFGWIGDRYRASGQGASKETTRWWRALEGWVRQQTRQFPRGGAGRASGGFIAAFPGAAARLDAGIPGEQNPPAP